MRSVGPVPELSFLTPLVCCCLSDPAGGVGGGHLSFSHGVAKDLASSTANSQCDSWVSWVNTHPLRASPTKV